MRVTLKHDNDNNWDGEDDGPDALDATFVVVEQELAAAPLTDPSLDWYDLHEIVAKRDGQNGHGRDIEHGVELANLADNWDVLKVLVEQFIHLAWVGGLAFRWRA